MRTSLLLAATLLTTAAFADLTLVRDGAARATIITLGDTPEVAEAGEALQRTLFKMSGARVRVLMGFPRSRTNEIIVFVPADRLDAAYAPDAAKPLAAKIRDDGFALYCDGTRALYIIARKPTAFVFGAHEVLQRLGCRWFFPGELGEEIPAQKTVSLPAMSEVQNPDMV
ncbi:MAG: hypothetical protein KKI08_06530, partial [Armatimonadetes bacterium]|nr:hypothetical protein [Armatimonadota bacterium]